MGDDEYIKENRLEEYLPKWMNDKDSSKQSEKEKDGGGDDMFEFVEDIAEMFDDGIEDEEKYVDENVNIEKDERRDDDHEIRVVNENDNSSQEDDDNNKTKDVNETSFEGVKKNGKEKEKEAMS